MSAQRRLPVETPREWIRHADENLGVAEREMQWYGHRQTANRQ